MPSTVKQVGTKRWSMSIPPYLQKPLANALAAMEVNDLPVALHWFGVCMQSIPPDLSEAQQREVAKPILYFGGQVAGQAYLAVKNREPQPSHDELVQWAGMAEAIVQGACEVSPDDPVPYHNLGRLYQDNGDDSAALASYQQALRLDPNMVETWGNLGTLYAQQGENALGHQCNQRCVELEAPLATGKMAQAFIHLRYHRYEQGWALWRERWNDLVFTGNYGRKDLKKPHWRGEPYRRKDKILVTGEQGLGDHIQFARYIQVMLDEGYPITAIETRRPLKRWMQACFPTLEVVVRDEEMLPEYTKHCTMMDFPSIVHTTVNTVPPPVAPVVTPKRLDVPEGHKAIGIAWEGAKGNSADYLRSIPREKLSVLADIPNVTWVNLQFGSEGWMNCRAWLGKQTIDGTKDCTDVLDTASVIKGLDQVICVDTLTAHLSASLGVPTTILHRYCREWRWGDRSVSEGDSSLWYPSVTSWDKTETDDWTPLLQRVRDSLCE